MDGTPDDMWSPYKQLYKIIRCTLANPTDTSLGVLEAYLKRYKHTFATILKNPPKNERNRAHLKRHVMQGVPIVGNSRTMVLSNDLVDECIIISDMFDLDEILALELLCTAQRQLSQHPGLPRGLIAILLYYDGRKSIATSLRDLFQVTSGISWASELPKELAALISSYTQSLVDDSNILDRIMDLLELELDFINETVLLKKNRALGTVAHQNQVFELFMEIRLALATSLFNWSAQRSLPSAIVVRLIKYFSQYKVTEATGTMDDTALTMLMTLLYSLNTCILQKQDDNQLIQKLNIIKDNNFAHQVYNALLCVSIPEQIYEFNSIIKFAFGLCLCGLRHASQYLQNNLYKIVNYDEQLIDEAISLNVFKLIYYFILEKDIIYKNEFFYRRIHELFTDFIDFMHSKVTELRGRADETAKTVMSFTKEGLEPPQNLDNNFEMLMLCIGKFYKGNRAKLSLCVEYWGPMDISMTSTKSETRTVSLFKFIRLAGELLPTTLFIPYLKMIAGLSSCEKSARNTFNLLKQSNGLSGSSTLSWEHFFGSLTRYYASLRQEQGPTSETIYRSRIINRSINPNEIEGLRAVLEVVRSVAASDAIARIAMCEHSTWNPLGTFIGLLGSPIPLSLKADILLTLSDLAKSKGTSAILWNNLEASQVINTIPSTSVYNISNIEVEIEQNECRQETYPLTAGILELLHSLIAVGIPNTLGSGCRKPGFDPYLTFIINGIFMKFYNRNYKDPMEKWIIGEKCLKIIFQLLSTYEIKTQDFDESQESSTHPGFHIMLQLHKKSELLRLILIIIDDARQHISDYKKFYGKGQIEECILYCLKILRLSLTYQDMFCEAHSTACSTVLLSGLKKILLDVNPRTKRPDYILNTTFFIIYSNWLPFHALEAVKILHLVCKQPNATEQILGIFSQDEYTQNKLRQGFVDCLDSEYITTIGEADEVEGPIKIELEIKDAIIQLILDNLYYPIPNLSFFLLGIGTGKEHIVQGQRLYIMDWSSNCTKSLISLLDNQLEIRKSITLLDIDLEKIIERSFHLLFELCFNQKTSEPILRYLRSQNDFLYRHLKDLPTTKITNSNIINQISFLLKCAAIELKITAANCQLSRFEHMSELFVGMSSKISQETGPMELNQFYTNNTNSSHELVGSNSQVRQHNLFLCSILNSVDIEISKLSIPKWEYFKSTLINQIVNECEYKTERNLKLVDLRKLHTILYKELNIVQNTIASGQRKLIIKDIDSVLQHVIKINEQRLISFATVKFIEAWTQVTEILFTCAPNTCLPLSIKHELIIEIIQKILSKVTSNQPILETAVLMSGNILLLLINLRYCFTERVQYALEVNNTSELKEEIKTLDSKSNILNLKYILKNILEWIIVSGMSSQKLRINLYAAFLNCLCIIKEQTLIKSTDGINETQYISRLDKCKEINTLSDSNHVRMLMKLLSSFGEKFLEIICHDCIAGHDICKMSAMACINFLLEIDCTSTFLNFIVNRGYLSHIIESLIKSDDELCTILNNIPENMKCLYVYESKMSMLLCLANTHLGAELLLSNRVLEILSSMKVFNLHPDLKRKETWHDSEISDFIPPIDVRFRQILFPALHLCECLLFTLGTENQSIVSQVVHFLLSHCDMIEIILRAGNPFSDIGFSQEVSFITGIIACTFKQDKLSIRELESINDINVNLYRIQRLMMSIFHRFVISNSSFKDMFKAENCLYEPTEENRVLHLKYFLEITANAVLYCRNLVVNHSAAYGSEGLLFVPNINDIVQSRDNGSAATMQHHYNLSIIVNQLKGAVEYFHSQKAITESLLREKLTLKDIGLDATAKQKYADVLKKYNEKQNELNLCAFIAQQCIYILWVHLNYYMRLLPNSNYDNCELESVRSLETKTGANISKKDLSDLRKELVNVFNETFSKKLCSIAEINNTNDFHFNQSLLRKIKSLIQFAQ